MPRWLVISVTVLVIVALIPVSWAWYQAFRNMLSVRGKPELVRFTQIRLRRISILWVAQLSLAIVGLVSAFSPRPRPPWAMLTTTFGLLFVAISVAILSIHEMREIQLNNQQADSSDFVSDSS